MLVVCKLFSVVILQMFPILCAKTMRCPTYRICCPPRKPIQFMAAAIQSLAAIRALAQQMLLARNHHSQQSWHCHAIPAKTITPQQPPATAILLAIWFRPNCRPLRDARWQLLLLICHQQSAIIMRHLSILIGFTTSSSNNNSTILILNNIIMRNTNTINWRQSPP